MQLLKFQILEHSLIWISDAFTVYNSSVSRDYFKVRTDSMFSAPGKRKTGGASVRASISRCLGHITLETA